MMLHGSDISEDIRNQIEAVDSAATRMNRLVQGLMVLAKAEAGATHQIFSQFDLRLTVQNAADQVHHKPSQSVTYTDDGKEVSVNGSERDIERVFVNLIDNACRYVDPDGRIEVHLARRGIEAVVTVRDNGIGIAPEHLPHLFERFYRADAARSTETGGTGLGLAICKSIIEAANGTIRIESEVGVGTVATVTLPLIV
jgi:signal transduction histidine kinase